MSGLARGALFFPEVDSSTRGRLWLRKLQCIFALSINSSLLHFFRGSADADARRGALVLLILDVPPLTVCRLYLDQ